MAVSARESVAITGNPEKVAQCSTKHATKMRPVRAIRKRAVRGPVLRLTATTRRQVSCQSVQPTSSRAQPTPAARSGQHDALQQAAAAGGLHCSALAAKGSC